MRKVFVFSALVALVVAVSLPASAALTSTGPFAGTVSETWESFNNYNVGPYYLNDPTTIMGGAASISNIAMVVYEPGVANFGLNYYFASVSDGSKGMGITKDYTLSDRTVTITAADTWSSFGAYWATPPFSLVDVYAYDALGGYIGSDSFVYAGSGKLEWHGWTSDAAIKTITYSCAGVVIDGLQANTSAVPEPSSLIALAVGLGPLLALRRRKA